MSVQRALSASQVSALKADGVHRVAPSLYLQIRPQGTRSWLFRYSRNGQNQWMGLGAAADKSLTEARDEAAMLRVSTRKGGDPIAKKRKTEVVTGNKKTKAPSFTECAERYQEAHRAAWKNDKHIAQWESTLRSYAGPVIGKKPVDQVTVEDILEILNPIWTAKPETASRLRGRIEKVLGWATAMKYRTGDNPAAWNGALSHLLPAVSKVQKVEHHKAIPYAELPTLVAQLRRIDSTSAKAMLFTILTASRTGETTGATWDEIDLEAKLWVIPAERMKANREHRVPLQDAAIDILKTIPRDSRYIFRGLRLSSGISNMTMLMLLRDLRDDGITVHGFRSAFSTWAREQTDYPREIVESCLAHASGGAVELAYRRTDFLDKRRELMEQWAGFCLRPFTKPPSTPCL